MSKRYELEPMCIKCNNYICKIYHGTCRKYRFIRFFKRLFK